MSVTFGEQTATHRKGRKCTPGFLLVPLPWMLITARGPPSGTDAKQAMRLSTVMSILPRERLSRGQTSPSFLGADGHKSREK